MLKWKLRYIHTYRQIPTSKLDLFFFPVSLLPPLYHLRRDLMPNTSPVMMNVNLMIAGL